MTSSPSNNLSSCHHAETRLVGGVGDFSDHEEGITMHYECTECGEACDLLPIASNNLKEQIKSVLFLDERMTNEIADPTIAQILTLTIDFILERTKMQDSHKYCDALNHPNASCTAKIAQEKAWNACRDLMEQLLKAAYNG